MARPLALVHDYLTQRGGAERVVATWCEGFPHAPLFTSLYEASSTFPEFSHHEIHTSWLNRLTPLRQRHRLALPLLGPTMDHWHIDADVVLASSSGWAHGIRTDGRLVVYCHAPARWLYQRNKYISHASLGSRAKMATQILNPALRAWDQRAAQRVDTYVANSRFTASMIEEIYGRRVEVIAPPVRLAPSSVATRPAVDVIVVARLLPYKNVDLVLDVASLAPDVSFRVVGDGPLREHLRQRATSNVSFAGTVDDDALWAEYGAARVHLALSHEDFGITPLEAAGMGRATVARASGGYLDTVSEDTGILVDEHSLNASTVLSALRAALSQSWNADTLRAHARTFSPDAHLNKIRALIDAQPTPH